MTDDIRQFVRESLGQLEESYPEKTLKMAEEMIVNMYENNLTPREAFKIDPDIFEQLYTQGYNLFNSGKYKDALRMFSFLRRFDPPEYRYHFAVAACHQRLKEYNDAIANYLICNQLDPLDPIPYFHMYDCFRKLDKVFPALDSLVRVLVLTKKNKKYSEMREKAKLEYAGLKEQLKEHPYNKL